MHLQEVDNFGVDKIKKFGWSLADTRGHFREINKHELQVDKEYQRDADGSDFKVRRISSEWSWIACNTITVADRDGEYFVVDGQHRVLAALKRSDIKTLPCMVHKMEGKREEADAFLRANKNRKPMNARQSFKARVVAGDAAAIEVQRLCRQVGRTVADKADGQGVAAVAAMLSCVEADIEAMQRIWPMVAEICSGRVLHGDILKGIFTIERKLVDASLTETVYRQKLLRAGYDALLDGIKKAKTYYGAGGERIIAIGVLNVVNAGLRANKLDVDL